MDVNLNSNVASTTTTTSGVNSEITDKDFNKSLSNPTNVSDVTSVAQASEEQAANNESESATTSSEDTEIEGTQDLVETLNRKNLGLSFTVNEEIDRTIINVMDRDTDDIIRQIPSEEFVRVVKSIKNYEERVETDGGTVDKSTLKGMILTDTA